jgi:hypothetical protein
MSCGGQFGPAPTVPSTGHGPLMLEVHPATYTLPRAPWLPASSAALSCFWADDSIYPSPAMPRCFRVIDSSSTEPTCNEDLGCWKGLGFDAYMSLPRKAIPHHLL